MFVLILFIYNIIRRSPFCGAEDSVNCLLTCYLRIKMKLYCLALGLMLSAAPVLSFAQYAGQNETLTKKDVCIPLKALAFDYKAVRLLDGPFKEAMEIEQRWLKEGIPTVSCTIIG